MTLNDHIIARIQTDGPMRLDEYMTTCLLHPKGGYYTTRDPLGRSGDFITAPEISQMFGELLGLAMAQTWLSHGAPAPFTLAELGPGRGTLMADALRACANVPGFLEAAEVVLVEVSPALRAVQSETLKKYAPRWIEGVEGFGPHPLYLIANEFFDALPIRQFIRDGDHWRERQVGVENGALTFGLSPAQPQPTLHDRLTTTKDGDMVEVSAAATAIAEQLGGHIAAHGGAALIVDYGGWRPLGDSFQAVKAHQKVSPLADPGQADLTAHVDFEALAQAARPAAHTPLTPQGVFLERLGITQRAQALARHLTGEALEAHITGHHRLTHPEKMGNLFQVMALYQDGSAPPPGLEQ